MDIPTGSIIRVIKAETRGYALAPFNGVPKDVIHGGVVSFAGRPQRFVSRLIRKLSRVFNDGAPMPPISVYLAPAGTTAVPMQHETPDWIE